MAVERALPMKVLSLGLSRTGTCTIQAALQTLGIPCFHYLDLLSNPTKCDPWSAALDAKFFNKGSQFTRKDWDLLLGDTSAVCDMPAWAFPLELIETYPEAKVVLVSRDIDRWYKSFDDNVINNFPSWGHYLCYLDPWWSGRLRFLAEKVMTGYFQAGGQEGWRKNAKRIYEEHNLLLRKSVPKDRLLEFDLSAGWEPLCSFLGVDIPNTPFPWLNDNDEAKQRLNEVLIKVLTRAGINVAWIGGTLLMGILAWAYL